MNQIQEILDTLCTAAKHPQKALDEVLRGGGKAIGCMPMYCPQELVYAVGMRPFAVWGADVEIREAGRYFPTFLCSVVQTALELGLQGKLDGLSGMMIPALCDSLKCMGQNWKAGVPQVPMIPVYHPQNRKTEAGVTFLRTQYEKILSQLETISGRRATDETIREAIALYNAQRVAMQRFAEVAGRYPELLSPAARSGVFKSAGFMDVVKHTALVCALVDALEKQPQQNWPGKRVVLTGILADSPALLSILAENNIAVVGDDVAAESRRFRTLVPSGDDPFTCLARQFSAHDGCSVLYDPKKRRGEMILDLTTKTGAQGVIVVMTKFCDPEEFDYVILCKQFRAAGMPHVLIEVDRQAQGLAAARTALETFCDMI